MSVGQPLFRMETEKVEMEIEADDRPPAPVRRSRNQLSGGDCDRLHRLHRRRIPKPAMSGPSTDDLRWLHRMMTTIRLSEERVTREFKRGDMPVFVFIYISR